MKHVEDNGWQELAHAIIRLAVEDWRYAKFQLRNPALASKRALDASRSCEKFFTSGWFETLSDLDGKVFLRSLKQGYTF